MILLVIPGKAGTLKALRDKVLSFRGCPRWSRAEPGIGIAAPVTVQTD